MSSDEGSLLPTTGRGFRWARCVASPRAPESRPRLPPARSTCSLPSALLPPVRRKTDGNRLSGRESSLRSKLPPCTWPAVACATDEKPRGSTSRAEGARLLGLLRAAPMGQAGLAEGRASPEGAGRVQGTGSRPCSPQLEPWLPRPAGYMPFPAPLPRAFGFLQGL